MSHRCSARVIRDVLRAKSPPTPRTGIVNGPASGGERSARDACQRGIMRAQRSMSELGISSTVAIAKSLSRGHAVVCAYLSFLFDVVHRVHAQALTSGTGELDGRKALSPVQLGSVATCFGLTLHLSHSQGTEHGPTSGAEINPRDDWENDHVVAVRTVFGVWKRIRVSR